MTRSIAVILSVLLVAVMSMAFTSGAHGQAWQGATLIDAGAGRDAFEPQIACDASGNALAVFDQMLGTDRRIYANRWDGSAWGTAGLIDAGAGNNADDPQIAFDQSGNAIAVFDQGLWGIDRVYANRWDGSAWGAAELLVTPATQASSPQVAFYGNGNAVTVFEQSDGANPRIYALSWNGSAWGAPGGLIDNGLSRDAAVPQIATDGSGNAIAVFVQSDYVNDRVYANYCNGSKWAVPTLIDAGAGNDAWGPQIAFDGSGNAIAVFGQRDGADWRVYANHWDGSAWGGATLIDAGAGNDAFECYIACDGNGNAIATFEQSDGVNDRVYANRWDGSAWGGATLIDLPPPATDASSARIAFDGSGNAMVVLEQHDGVNNRIYANRWDGSAWSGPRLIDAGANEADDPQIAFDGNGDAVAVFEQWDGANWRIYANRCIDSNYINLEASPTTVPRGGTVNMSWSCDFSRWDYRGVPVNIYLAAIKDPKVTDAPSSVASALSGGLVYLAGPQMREWYPYAGSVKEPTWSRIAFPPGPLTGTKTLPVPANPALAGNWVFATAFIRSDGSGYVRTDGLPVENSNQFKIQ